MSEESCEGVVVTIMVKCKIVKREVIAFALYKGLSFLIVGFKLYQIHVCD